MTVGRDDRSSSANRAKAAEHGRHAPFDVARSTAVKPTIAHLGIERRNGHSVDRHRILMGFQKQQTAAALRRRIARQASDEIISKRGDVLPPSGDFQAGQQPFQEIGHAMLVKFWAIAIAPIGFTLGVATSWLRMLTRSSDMHRIRPRGESRS